MCQVGYHPPVEKWVRSIPLVVGIIQEDCMYTDVCRCLIANNGATWAFGGVPMGGAGLGNPRPNNGPMTSFAQTIGGSSQPATPLDLS